MRLRSRILVADDDVGTNMSLCAMLGRAGYEVECASDGHAALGLALSGRFRIAIAGRSMSGVSGMEFCRTIRSAELPYYMYVLMLSGHPRASDVAECLAAGADDCMTRPAAEGELLARLNTAERMLSLMTRDVTLFALAKLAESRDPESSAHLERVRHYARLLAEGLRGYDDHAGMIDDEFVRMVFLTSPLHDIGKVGIPDSILFKPGQLTAEEFAIMTTHTTIGARALEAALQAHPDGLYLQMARDIALTHHERYDGGGYPMCMAGREIPLAGRIVALADAYDAMTSRSIYKQALLPDAARAVVLSERGGQFDPDIVDVFLSQERLFHHVHERFRDEQCTFESQRGSLRLAA